MHKIGFAGIVDGPEEYAAVKRAMDSHWHGPGKEAEAFEHEFAQFLGVKYALLTNSGSSANLLALKASDIPDSTYVLTSGCGFPATLNPILHLGYRPILVDYDLKTQNIDLKQVKEKVHQAAAIIVAHTMGNPIDMHELQDIIGDREIPIIEDCCEALGSTFLGNQVGTFGTVGTFSFYPSHQLNGLGGGGCVVTDDEDVAIRLRSLRNWGKLARKPSFTGDHVTDYSNMVDGIPYDDQYTYQTIGFNMQPTDVQAAYLREQLKRLPRFIKIRTRNWKHLESVCSAIPQLQLMKVDESCYPAYFGFTMVLKEGSRDSFAEYLEKHGVRTRPFFAGNITRHEPYKDLYQEFPVADNLMRNALFIGVWPGITQEQIEYVGETIKAYFNE